ncbi:MAG: hypothetical protein A2V62_12680 [Nitrospirae bacterium RBG_19FT_COMBO_58_9]|nr:MAG: hypothetical protein A2V62_12680 [Nitrospirae bacterium RBG_19FT_COMBO_58_9]
MIAFGFEFVNGFHNTANAVATVIYTNSMPSSLAVVWSGLFNLLGVLLSSGAVAFTIASLLPVELILQVGSRAGFTMVYALLLAAIIWNLNTWYFGLPSSSSHTLIGSIVGESLRLLLKQGVLSLTPEEHQTLTNFKQSLDQATKFIPVWVKVAIALALGMGTMIGWKRIVVTVGERIGKEHLTYAQGGTAELVAMTTIGAAESLGLPISAPHTLSSGVAGTMAANQPGLQVSTVRNILLAWALTLPASIALSGLLFFLLRHIL